jgi:hypothetical protein
VLLSKGSACEGGEFHLTATNPAQKKSKFPKKHHQVEAGDLEGPLLQWNPKTLLIAFHYNTYSRADFSTGEATSALFFFIYCYHLVFDSPLLGLLF